MSLFFYLNDVVYYELINETLHITLVFYGKEYVLKVIC